MKGSSKPVMLIEVLGTSVVLVGVLLMGTGWSEEYTKRQTLDAKAERVANAALATGAFEEGILEIELEGNYAYRYSDASQRFYLLYDSNPDDDASVVRNASMTGVQEAYDSIDAPSDWTQIGDGQSLILLKRYSGGGRELMISHGNPEDFRDLLN